MTFRVLGDGLPVDQIGGLEFYPQNLGVPIPLTVDGLLLWLKGDADTFQDSAKTIPAASDGDVLGAWADLSGFGNDALQSTTANKPLLKLAIVNNKPIIRFDGNNDTLSVALDLALSASDNLTIFFVSKPVSAANSKMVLGNQIDAGNRQGLRILYDNLERIEFFTVSGAGASTSVRTGVDANFAIVVAVLDAGVQEIYKNGSLIDSDTQEDMTGHSATLLLGINRSAGPSFFDGDIAEILIYNSALSTDDRQSIENYLNGRYAIF